MPDAVQTLDWDTAHWQVPVARVDGVVASVGALHEVGREARAKGVRLLYLSAPADDLTVAQHAASVPGLRMVDIRLVLSRQADESAEWNPLVRWAADADVDALRSLAGGAHTNTRFFHDPDLDHERAADLYRRWIGEQYGRADYDVVVAEVNGDVVGYVTLGAAEGQGRIGLLAVGADARGHGVGESLVRWTVRRAAERGCSRVVVGTQGGSSTAQRLYQRCGFTTESVDLLYHWWL